MRPADCWYGLAQSAAGWFSSSCFSFASSIPAVQHPARRASRERERPHEPDRDPSRDARRETAEGVLPDLTEIGEIRTDRGDRLAEVLAESCCTSCARG